MGQQLYVVENGVSRVLSLTMSMKKKSKFSKLIYKMDGSRFDYIGVIL